ncbi:MAG: class I SAM-dependent methyltransferase [Candidatus Cloacimonetes bacterium]|nr:class I SAM-dependent methyltransferase [Candidatus Cloacimonadota bacterium]
MKKNIRFYTQKNREAWNEVMPRHQKAVKQKLDQSFSVPGYTCINDQNFLQVLEKINLKGKKIVHLCCNNGTELMSLKNMGAGHCLGIDICDAAITEARERAEKTGIDCEFIRTDVYDIPQEFNESFDIALITAGGIGWLPDINLFFKKVSNLLQNSGIVLLHEIHPFSEMLPFDDNNCENKLQIIEPYFRDEPIEENSSLDYLGGTDYIAKTQYWHVHTISEIIMALINNSLLIKHFSEHPQDCSAVHKKQEDLKAGIPLSYLLIGKKTVYPNAEKTNDI